MSPALGRASVTAVRFPRVSGDEPSFADFDQAMSKFSPRERG